MNTHDMSVSESRYYRVGRYRQTGAAKILAEAGLDRTAATKLAKRVPNGLPFIYNVQTGMPVASALLFLLRIWRKPKLGAEAPRSLDTAAAQAYDICDFYEHLDAYGESFVNINQALFNTWVDNKSRIPSERTGRVLSQKTIRRQVAHVSSFVQSDEFKATGNATFDPNSAPLGGRVDEPEIHPFTPDEWKRILPHLGPLPSERDKANLLQSSALRLIAEWAIRTGARRTEIANLTVDMIENHEPDPESRDQARRLKLRVTKGGRPRTLWVPVDLLIETRRYIDTERAAIISRSNRADHSYLFVNIGRTLRDRGSRIQRGTITTWFRNAVISAGLTRRLVAGDDGSLKLNRFVFHDLRHTFAVWTYVGLDRIAEIKRPWKIIQARLGHRTLETTERIYLAFIEEHETAISRLLGNEYQKWNEGV
jgi:integrase/recombinase XerC